MYWNLVIDFTILSLSLLIATYLRTRLKFLQRFLVPNAITAGFVGLGLMYIIKEVYPEIIPAKEILGNIVYHLLAITFISIGLKKRQKYIGKNSLSTAFMLTLGYAVEGFVGYTITLLFLFTFIPDIFPTFGMLFELGFGQSPGQAYALGKQWESLGFTYGGTVGLTFGAIGFLWACFVGIPFLNWGIKRGYIKGINKELLSNNGFYKKESEGPITGRHTTHPDVIESATLHIAIIGFVYLIDYFFIKFIVYILGRIDSGFGVQFGSVLWAYHAFFATLFALFFSKILNKLDIHHILDNNTLTVISGSSVDFLITAAVMAIEIVVVVKFIVPIVIICVAGGITVMFMIAFLSKRCFNDYLFERIISIFGLLTGTISTGLALLRVVDPQYETPVASDLVLGSGFSLFLGFPLLFSLNIPALHQNTKAYLLTDLGLFGYIILLLSLMIIFGLLRKKSN